MSKILRCPECGEEKPVRNDAVVCSGSCRVKRWRRVKKENKTDDGLSDKPNN